MPSNEYGMYNRHMKLIRKINDLKLAAKISLILAILCFGFFMVRNIGSISAYAETYHKAAAIEEYADSEVELAYYGDFSKAQFLLWGQHDETEAAREYEDFMDYRSGEINEYIVCDVAVYAVILCALSLLAIQSLMPGKESIAAMVIYAAYLLIIVITMLIKGIPLKMFGWESVLLIICGFLSVLSFESAMAMIMSHFNKKLLIAFIVLALTAGFYLSGFMAKVYLISPAKIPSFEYLLDIDERFGEEGYDDIIYYDNEKDVMVIDGKEYEPVLVDNSEHANGMMRPVLYGLEVINPSAGVYLEHAVRIINDEYQVDTPAILPYAYIVHSLLWITARKLLYGKKSG